MATDSESNLIMKCSCAVLVLALLAVGPDLHADFAGPQSEWKAISPDGNLVVRISEQKGDSQLTATFFEYDVVKNEYVRGPGIPVSHRAQMLCLSNAGDLIMIAFSEEKSISLYSKDGKLTRKWSLKEFLSAKEIRACAETGSTLQWFDEGRFSGRTFHFRGPSRKVRGLEPSYTVMRGPNLKVSFGGSIDASTAKLTRGGANPR